MLKNDPKHDFSNFHFPQNFHIFLVVLVDGGGGGGGGGGGVVVVVVLVVCGARWW